MATYNWASLSNGTLLHFDPAHDVLHFSDTVRPFQVLFDPDEAAGRVTLTVFEKHVTLDTSVFTLTTASFVFDRFGSGSAVIGDNTVSTATDNDPHTLTGGSGQDLLYGGSGDDTFVFRRGEAQGDEVVDFNGNGAAAGDRLQFQGYGTAAAGASFTQVDATHWSINSSDGTVHEVITLMNAATVHASDYTFI